jgi:hypothetical protein
MFDAKLDQIIAKKYAEYRSQQAGATGSANQTGTHRTLLNAYKHGLTGQIHVFSAEEHEAFEKHCQSVVEALAPVGAFEQQLAQAIAEGHWRLNRARAIEAGIFACGNPTQLADPDEQTMSRAMAQAKTWIADGRNLQLLSLYEQRIQRSVEKHMAELRTLRAERKAARDQALEEAVLLSQLAKSKGETYNPAVDFPSPVSVFSNPEMELSLPKWLARKQRLDEARALPKTRQNQTSGRKMPAAA